MTSLLLEDNVIIGNINDPRCLFMFDDNAGVNNSDYMVMIKGGTLQSFTKIIDGASLQGDSITLEDLDVDSTDTILNFSNISVDNISVLNSTFSTTGDLIDFSGYTDDVAINLSNNAIDVDNVIKFFGPTREIDLTLQNSEALDLDGDALCFAGEMLGTNSSIAFTNNEMVSIPTGSIVAALDEMPGSISIADNTLDDIKGFVDLRKGVTSTGIVDTGHSVSIDNNLVSGSNLAFFVKSDIGMPSAITIKDNDMDSVLSVAGDAMVEISDFTKANTTTPDILIQDNTIAAFSEVVSLKNTASGAGMLGTITIDGNSMSEVNSVAVIDSVDFTNLTLENSLILDANENILEFLGDTSISGTVIIQSNNDMTTNQSVIYAKTPALGTAVTIQNNNTDGLGSFAANKLIELDDDGVNPATISSQTALTIGYNDVSSTGAGAFVTESDFGLIGHVVFTDNTFDGFTGLLLSQNSAHTNSVIPDVTFESNTYENFGENSILSVSDSTLTPQALGDVLFDDENILISESLFALDSMDCYSVTIQSSAIDTRDASNLDSHVLEFTNIPSAINSITIQGNTKLLADKSLVNLVDSSVNSLTIADNNNDGAGSPEGGLDVDYLVNFEGASTGLMGAQPVTVSGNIMTGVQSVIRSDRGVPGDLTISNNVVEGDAGVSSSVVYLLNFLQSNPNSPDITLSDNSISQMDDILVLLNTTPDISVIGDITFSGGTCDGGGKLLTADEVNFNNVLIQGTTLQNFDQIIDGTSLQGTSVLLNNLIVGTTTEPIVSFEDVAIDAVIVSNSSLVTSGDLLEFAGVTGDVDIDIIGNSSISAASLVSFEGETHELDIDVSGNTSITLTGDATYFAGPMQGVNSNISFDGQSTTTFVMPAGYLISALDDIPGDIAITQMVANDVKGLVNLEKNATTTGIVDSDYAVTISSSVVSGASLDAVLKSDIGAPGSITLSNNTIDATGNVNPEAAALYLSDFLHVNTTTPDIVLEDNVISNFPTALLLKNVEAGTGGLGDIELGGDFSSMGSVAVIDAIHLTNVALLESAKIDVSGNVLEFLGDTDVSGTITVQNNNDLTTSGSVIYANTIDLGTSITIQGNNSDGLGTFTATKLIDLDDDGVSPMTITDGPDIVISDNVALSSGTSAFVIESDFGLVGDLTFTNNDLDGFSGLVLSQNDAHTNTVLPELTFSGNTYTNFGTILSITDTIVPAQALGSILFDGENLTLEDELLVLNGIDCGAITIRNSAIDVRDPSNFDNNILRFENIPNTMGSITIEDNTKLLADRSLINLLNTGVTSIAIIDNNDDGGGLPQDGFDLARLVSIEGAPGIIIAQPITVSGNIVTGLQYGIYSDQGVLGNLSLSGNQITGDGSGTSAIIYVEDFVVDPNNQLITVNDNTISDVSEVISLENISSSAGALGDIAVTGSTVSSVDSVLSLNSIDLSNVKLEDNAALSTSQNVLEFLGDTNVSGTITVQNNNDLTTNASVIYAANLVPGEIVVSNNNEDGLGTVFTANKVVFLEDTAVSPLTISNAVPLTVSNNTILANGIDSAVVSLDFGLVGALSVSDNAFDGFDDTALIQNAIHSNSLVPDISFSGNNYQNYTGGSVLRIEDTAVSPQVFGSVVFEGESLETPAEMFLLTGAECDTVTIQNSALDVRNSNDMDVLRFEDLPNPVNSLTIQNNSKLFADRSLVRLLDSSVESVLIQGNNNDGGVAQDGFTVKHLVYLEGSSSFTGAQPITLSDNISENMEYGIWSNRGIPGNITISDNEMSGSASGNEAILYANDLLEANANNPSVTLTGNTVNNIGSVVHLVNNAAGSESLGDITFTNGSYSGETTLVTINDVNFGALNVSGVSVDGTADVIVFENTDGQNGRITVSENPKISTSGSLIASVDGTPGEIFIVNNNAGTSVLELGNLFSLTDSTGSHPGLALGDDVWIEGNVISNASGNTQNILYSELGLPGEIYLLGNTIGDAANTKIPAGINVVNHANSNSPSNIFAAGNTVTNFGKFIALDGGNQPFTTMTGGRSRWIFNDAVYGDSTFEDVETLFDFNNVVSNFMICIGITIDGEAVKVWDLKDVEIPSNNAAIFYLSDVNLTTGDVFVIDQDCDMRLIGFNNTIVTGGTVCNIDGSASIIGSISYEDGAAVTQSCP